jgi:hypothetical protein
MPNTYTELRKTTVGTATNSVTFDLTGISGYTDLEIVCNYGLSTAGNTLAIQMNSVTASVHSWTWMFGDGSSATSARGSNTAFIPLISLLGSENSLTTQANLKFQNYANTTTYKTILVRAGRSTSGNYPGTGAQVALWRGSTGSSTEAITSIKLYDPNASNIIVGSTFSLYGIANADQGAAKATGGIITEDSQYWYHTFGASGAFIPKQSLTCDVLVVAGGGGGGKGPGGGGAGGGYRTTIGGSALSVTATTYNVTVGAGGVGAIATTSTTTNGSDSVFSTITSTGGGGGGRSNNSVNGRAGGSGGGGAYNGVTAGTGGAASPSGQGNAGGSATTSNFNGAGGGGASAVGLTGTTGSSGGNGGAGGAGASNSISGISVAYAGGGGGGGGDAGNAVGGAGGTGGGGAGGNGVSGGTGGTGTNGALYLGGGGGGGGQGSSVDGNGGNGGSGIVIIRYAK